MDTRNLPEDDPDGEAVPESPVLRPARGYRILFAQDNLNFRPLQMADPVPLGRQILSAAGIDVQADFSLSAILPTGDFEDMRLDEPFDLRERGAERFIAFHTDRDYKLTLDDDQLAWGKPAINGAALYTLAKVDEDEAVFLEVRGGEDRLIEPDEIVDLTAPGIEHFITGPRPARTFEIIVNARQHIVNDKQVTFEEVVQLAFPGPHGPNTVFAVTYRHAASKPNTGDLAPGGFVEVKRKGTVFNVSPTDKS